MIGCCGHVTTDKRIIYIYASNYGPEQKLQHANSATQHLCRLADAHSDRARLIRSVRHLHIIVDELVNETK